MLKAAIIGCGMITERRHAPVLADRPDRVQVVALSDLSGQVAFRDEKKLLTWLINRIEKRAGKK